jgi:hypothetical protein
MQELGKMSEDSILSKLYKDPRTIYTLLSLALIVPYLNPVGLPISISSQTSEAFDLINSLESGDVVMFSVDISSGAWGELAAGGKVLLQNCFKIPGIKIVLVNFDPQGQIFAGTLLDSIDKFGKEYGKDYVLLGFVPGGKSVGGAALADDIHGVFSKDFYGTSIDSLEMMSNINNHEDITMVIDVDWGAGAEAFLYQWVGPYGTTLVAHLTNQMAPTFEPHYNAGNVKGFIVGVRGAAEYELLAEEPGVGVATTDALSTSHLLVVISIIVGNVIYFMNKRGT